MRLARRLRGLVFVAICGAAGPLAARSPQINYMLECQGCHLADGTASAGAVPALEGAVGRFAQVPGGREYLVRVPGSAQSWLSDSELAQVLNWIIVRFGPADAAASFAPFTAAEVKRYRGRPLVEVERTRRELLRAIDARASGVRP